MMLLKIIFVTNREICD